MTITRKKSVVETLEIDFSTPKYYKDGDDVLRITNESVIRVTGQSILTREAKRLSDDFYLATVEESIRGGESSEQEFNEAFDLVLNKINSLAGISNVPTLQLQD